MTKETITSLHFLLKKLVSLHPSACEQSREKFASPERGSEFRLPEHRSSAPAASARELTAARARVLQGEQGHSQVNVGQKPVSQILPSAKEALCYVANPKSPAEHPKSAGFGHEHLSER